MGSVGNGWGMTTTHAYVEHSDPDFLAALVNDLEARVSGEIRFDAGSRAAYSTDASNYRQVPIGVVVPRDVESGAAAVRVCRDHDVPLLSRGGGTSLAGECCNAAIVIDWSKYCNRVEHVDVDNKRIIAQPGAVLDEVNRLLSRDGLMVGQKPSTHPTCTIGGMIGNNSCGSTAQAYGKMVDAVRRLEVITYDGTRMWVGATDDEEYAEIAAAGDRRAEIYERLRRLRDAYLGEIRTNYPDIPRRVSGYNLDDLLPEKGFNVARALTGSESTLVTVLRAEIDVVEVPKFRSLVVLGYPDITTAADAVPRVVEHDPLAVEGLDDRLVSLEREEHFDPDALSRLPEGAGWLMVQFGGDTDEQVREHAERFMDDMKSVESLPRPHEVYMDDPAREDRLWEVREAGLGATAYPPDEHATHEGWEDAAVPPDRLGDYLRDFRDLLHRYDYEGASLYGHFGHGCVHTRIPFELRTDDGIAHVRAFVHEAADLVVSYGGSLSGEHGDGQSRGELLPKMFGPELIAAFKEMKDVFDPANRMNPGKVVEPYRMDENLKLRHWFPKEPDVYFTYEDDGGSFAAAATRCVGVGKCRQPSGGVMCPSYRATHEERHSTRGRSRLLMEMLRGDVITDGWRSAEVHDALDLCLACKGCKTDCPVDVDMATYKAEFLAHHYAGRIRPMAHYSMGWLPLWSRLAAEAPGIVNTVAHAPVLSRVLKRAGGIAAERELPRFTGPRFSDRFADHTPSGDGRNGTVVLWPDTFTNGFAPWIADAAVRVLEDAGFRVEVPPGTVCCGLTWVSTGQLGVARRVLNRTIDALLPRLEAGVPLVVLEPSCAAVFRSDAPELLGGERARLLSARTHTLAELLTERAPDWRPRGTGAGAGQRLSALARVHCHQHAILGFGTDTALLDRFGVDVDALAEGCCGVAGNFGFERGHEAVSHACAEDGLWPQVKAADPASAVLADGFSCRTQLEAGDTGRHAVHLAELLDALNRDRPLGRYPEKEIARVELA